MIEFFGKLLDTSDFLPRWQCGNWSTAHGWLHIASAILIGSAYSVFASLLLHHAWKRRHLLSSFRFAGLFGTFILLCGMVHFAEAMMFWWPAYRLAGVVKGTAAVASWGTLLAFIPVIPRALTLRRSLDLEAEVRERARMEEALRRSQDELEERVRARTAELDATLLELREALLERTRVEAALRDSEERYRLLVEISPQVVWTSGPDGRMTFGNHRWTELTGMSTEESLGEGWVKAIHPDHRRQVAGAWKAASRTGSMYEVEIPIRQGSDGLYRWHLTRALPQRDGNGQIVQWVGTSLDIHDRHQVEILLREQEALFHQLAETLPQFVWISDPEGNSTYYNRRWYEYTGIDEKQPSGRLWLEYLHPDDLQLAQSRWNDALASGEPYHIEYRFRDTNGDYRWFLGLALPFRSADGRIARWFGTCTDIEEQKQTEQELRQTRENLELSVQQRTAELSDMNTFLTTVLESIEDGVVACDEHGRLTLFNRMTRLIHGLPAEPMPLENLSRHYSLYRRDGRTLLPMDEIPLVRALRGEHVRDVEILIAPELGVSRLVQVNGRALTDHAGRCIGAVVSMHDVTERRTAEEELRKTLTELQRSNRELQAFASVASHDLQEPLRKIHAFGDRLMKRCHDQLDQQGRDYLQRIMAASVRMSGLINDLLAFSRVTTNARPFSRVDLNRIVREVLIDLEERVRQTNGQVHVGSLPTIDADPLQMRQLFQNLIGNALKFHQADVAPVVHIEARLLPVATPEDGSEPTASQCEINVKDNGIGFDEKYTDRIFSLFQTLHARDKYEGTGMGLAICRKIVERHGGTIAARSRPGEGARFIVTLPCTQQPGEPVHE